MPPFSKQRRNTVYDLTALRIHHDDFRIPSSDSNYRYRRDKKIIRDVRGNWIAKDAGGTGKIPWYTKVDGGEGEEEEDGEDMEVEKDEDGEGEGNTEKEDEGGSSEDEEYRRGQRRRFYEDMSYLNDHVEPQQPSGSMPVPDSVSTTLILDAVVQSLLFLCRTSLKLFTTLQVYTTTTWVNYMIQNVVLRN